MLRLAASKSIVGRSDSTAREAHALPANELSSGDIVQLRSANNVAGSDRRSTANVPTTGLVHRTTATRITVALEADVAENDIAEPLALLKLVDETTHKRLRVGLNALRTGTLPLTASQTGGTFVDAPGAAVATSAGTAAVEQ